MKHDLKFYFMLPQPPLVIRIIHAKTPGLLWKTPGLCNKIYLKPQVSIKFLILSRALCNKIYGRRPLEHNLKIYFMLPQPLLVIRVIHAKTPCLYQVPKPRKSKMIPTDGPTDRPTDRRTDGHSHL